MSDQIMKDAWATLRPLVLINGGAAIAILTFAGGLAKDHKDAQIASIADGLIWFACGMTAAALASGISYAINYCYGAEAHASMLDFDLLYVHATKNSVKFRHRGKVFHWLAVLLALGSSALFVMGVWTVSGAIAHLD